MGSADFQDLSNIPGNVADTAAMAAGNAAHLAGILKTSPYPGTEA